MHTKRSSELLDLADTQWLSLNELVCALERPLDQPADMVKRLVSAYSVDGTRPARIVYDNGTGQMLLDSGSTPDNETLSAIVGHQLKSRDERKQASDQLQRMSDETIVEFTKQSLHGWLVRCDLPEIAETLFGQWMRKEYLELLKNNLICATKDENANTNDTNKNLDDSNNKYTVTYDQIKTLSGKQTPASTKAWLAANDIAYYTGARGRPCTTLTALNKGLGITTTASNDSDHTPTRPKRKIEL